MNNIDMVFKVKFNDSNNLYIKPKFINLNNLYVDKLRNLKERIYVIHR